MSVEPTLGDAAPRSTRLTWLTALFAAFLALLVLLADRGQLPALLALHKHVPFGDKVGHFLLMGTLSFLVNLTLRAKRARVFGVPVLAGSAAVAIVVTLEELTQLRLPRRNFDLVDLSADYAGIFVFGQLARGLVARRAIGTAAAPADPRA